MSTHWSIYTLNQIRSPTLGILIWINSRRGLDRTFECHCNRTPLGEKRGRWSSFQATFGQYRGSPYRATRNGHPSFRPQIQELVLRRTRKSHRRSTLNFPDDRPPSTAFNQQASPLTGISRTQGAAYKAEAVSAAEEFRTPCTPVRDGGWRRSQCSDWLNPESGLDYFPDKERTNSLSLRYWTRASLTI